MHKTFLLSQPPMRSFEFKINDLFAKLVVIDINYSEERISMACTGILRLRVLNYGNLLPGVTKKVLQHWSPPRGC